MQTAKAKFSVGQLVQHDLFDYRGVIIDVDPQFQGADDWYEQVAHTRPPKDQPWYHVLVDNAVHSTYVAERNLQPDETRIPITHPGIARFFDDFQDGAYRLNRQIN